MGNHTNRSQVHNNLNQLLEDADYTYEYTVNGDLQKKISRRTGEQTEYVWNSEGKISGITVKRSDGTIKSVIENKYDALGRRIARIANNEEVRYVYDGEHIIAEIGANDSVRAVYLHSLGVDEPLAMVRDMNGNGEFEGNEVFFFSKDHLNSVHDLTDFEGKPVQRYNYTAYGQTKIEKTGAFPSESFVQNPFGYTSREWEQETGDYYYRARFYDPRTGRFLSEDPIGFDSGDMNQYRYVLNSPTNFRDPSGQFLLPVFILTYAAYETGFFLGATYNKLVDNIPYSSTYSDYNLTVSATSHIVPFADVLLNTDVYRYFTNPQTSPIRGSNSTNKSNSGPKVPSTNNPSRTPSNNNPPKQLGSCNG